MNTILIKNRIFILSILSVLIIFICCYDFEFIDQPTFADPNSTFDVPIILSVGATEDGQGGTPYFGIQLPVGWSVKDSITYEGIHSGTFIYSTVMSDSMEIVESSPDGYYWWVSVGDSVDSLRSGSVYYTPQIQTNNRTGLFYIDYMLGDDDSNINYIRSDNHRISVGVSTPITVANTNDSGEGSLRRALADVSYGGEILFNLSYPAEIVLDSQLVIDRNVRISGSKAGDLIISGKNNNRVILIENLNEDINVNISNLSISNGNASGESPDGGGIYCNSSNLSLQDISIINNSSTNDGGGIYCNSSNLSLLDISIMGNSSTNDGGGICSNSSFLVVTRAVVAKNKSVRGGGIYLEDSDAYLTNATITDNNSTENGGGIWSDDRGYAEVQNSILWNNSPESIHPEGLGFAVYSDIQGGSFGEYGNIDTDPIFADTIHFYLSENSPCIDAGDPDTMFNDLEDVNNPGFALWPALGTLCNDMGAYGGQGEYAFIVAIKDDDRGYSQLPIQFRLSQNYPNPFNPSTKIEFTLPKSENVELKVFNILGKEVTTLVSNKLNQGNHTYQFDGKNLASGVYYYQLIAGDYNEVKKMILLR